MKRILPCTWYALAFVGISMLGCGGGEPVVESGADRAPAEEVAGLREFRATCSLCHGANGEGNPRLGKDLRRNEFVRGKSDAEMIGFLELGRSATHPDNERGVEMPPRGGNASLTEAELAAIVSYLRSIQ